MTRSLKTRLVASAMVVATAYSPLFASFNSSAAYAQTTQNTTYSYLYDAMGNLTQVTDPLGRVSNQSVDALTRVQQQLQPPAVNGAARPTINYTYDLGDQLASVSDPRALVTTYSTTGLGDATGQQSPDTGGTSRTYNGAGMLATSTDARGKVTTYQYDVLNRLVKLGYASGTPTVFEYDGGPIGAVNAIGRLSRMSDESGNTVYTYDVMGRLLDKTQTASILGRTMARTLRHAYDGSGRLASLTYPSGARINYIYDAAGQVRSLTLNPADEAGAPNALVVTVLMDQISYSPFGPVRSWVWGNSSPAAPNLYTRTYDLDGRVTSYPLGNVAGATPGFMRTIAYDAGSNITAMTHAGNAGAASYDQQFGYDGQDRLTSYISSSSSQGYTYDASGNRTRVSYGSAVYANTVSGGSNRLDATTGPLPAKTDVYDGAGNLRSDGTIAYTYSDRGRLSGSVNASVTSSYLYNGVGQRVSKMTPLVPMGATVYVDDQGGHVVGEYFGTSTTQQETVYLGDLPVAVLKPTAGTPGVATAVYYVYADHINTPRVVTSTTTGDAVWRWDNTDPFGVEQPNENPAGSGVFVFNLRFPGQIFDRETNTHYNYYRDYDPQTGRYVQSDPIGLVGGINTYGYSLGNPISNADPHGLFVPLVVAGVCAAGGCEALLAASAATALWWQQTHPATAISPWASSGGRIPPQDFPGGISYPPKQTPTECHVEVPPIKPKLPPKGNCEEALSQCMSMASSGSGFGRVGATIMCATGYLVCKKMMGGGNH